MLFINQLGKSIKIKLTQILLFFLKNEIILRCLNDKIIKIKSKIYLIKAQFKKSSKIFGIGLSKTGTTSLALALKELGYKTQDYPHLPKLYEEIEKNDALTDITIAVNYRKLDKKFPNSKFILTIRNIDSWLESYQHHLKSLTHSRELRKWEKKIMIKIYGTIDWDKKKFKKGYSAFINDVLKHFEGRNNDFLILDIISGEGYEKLCPFLNKETLHVPFPHKNIGKFIKNAV